MCPGPMPLRARTTAGRGSRPGGCHYRLERQMTRISRMQRILRTATDQGKGFGGLRSRKTQPRCEEGWMQTPQRISKCGRDAPSRRWNQSVKSVRSVSSAVQACIRLRARPGCHYTLERQMTRIPRMKRILQSAMDQGERLWRREISKDAALGERKGGCRPQKISKRGRDAPSRC